MNMKLSYRDKVIFIVVIVILVLVAGFFVFIKSKITESQDVKNNLTIKQQEQDELKAKIETLPTLKKTLEDSIKKVDDAQSIFLTEQEAYESDQYVHDLMIQAGEENFMFKGMELTGEVEGSLSQYFYIRNDVAYDLKINADLTGDSLDQEVYDKYYKTNPKAADDVTVAVDELVITIGMPVDENECINFETVKALFDSISLHDKTVYLRGFESGEGEITEYDGVEYADVNITVDVFSVHHMDTSKAR